MKVFTIPILIGTICVSFIPSSNTPSGYWENEDTYIYYTQEPAQFEYEFDGVAYFETTNDNIWGAYVYDSELIEGETYTLTFENRENKIDYLRAEEYGIESTTQIGARIISID